MTENSVLLVEDNADDVDLTLLAFSEIRFPYQMAVVRDGAEALDYLFGRGKYGKRGKENTPTLVLLDLKLPKLDGLEVLRIMRADSLLKYVVVAILTSSKEETDRISALNLGTNLYFRKALDFDEGVATAQQIAQLLPPKNEIVRGYR